MAIQFNPDRWAQVRETYTKWWDGSLKRPIFQVTQRIGTGPDPHPHVPVLSQATCADFSWTPEEVIDKIDWQLSGNLYSQSSPAPLGISQQVLGVTADGVRYTARISVQRTVTGNEALQLLIGADIQNPPPPAGMRYGLARVTFSLDRTSDGSAISVDPTDFDIYSFRGDDYADCIVTPPYPAFGGTLLPGQSISGYVPYLVRESEQRPLLSIDANYDGTGDIWLALR